MNDSKDNQYATAYTIPDRKLGAVEHPMIVKNVDKGLRSLGHAPDFHAILASDSPQVSVPLYLRQDNPSTRPLLSFNASSHNVVLKVTVPKRTGRKRKRGTDDPFEGSAEQGQTTAKAPETEGTEAGRQTTDQVCSYARVDAPEVLRRKLVDTVGKYSVEPVGIVKHTHRYRGYADFQWSFGNSSFMNGVVSSLVPGQISKLREFDLKPGTDIGPGTEVLPPPTFTSHGLGFVYNYTQNIYTKENPKKGLVHVSGEESEQSEDEFNRIVNSTSYSTNLGVTINYHQYPVPTGPQRRPNMKNTEVAAIVTEFRRMMDERPLWTRRALVNRFNEKFGPGFAPAQVLKQCVQFVGYQFKGGPWRDSIVRYGCDPRTDPSCRKYQTVVFKLTKTRVGSVGMSWQYVRRSELGHLSTPKTFGSCDVPFKSHLFDGRSFTTDSKVWQVCDIIDPPVARLLAEAQMQPECSETTGYYHPVVLRGVKMIMRIKLLAIRFNRNLSGWDWDNLVDGYLRAEASGFSENIMVSLPHLGLTAQEREQITGRRIKPGICTVRKTQKGFMAKKKRLKATETLSEHDRVSRIAKWTEIHRRKADEDVSGGGAAAAGVADGASSREPNICDDDEEAGVAKSGLMGVEEEGDEDDVDHDLEEDIGDEDGHGNAGQQELLDFLSEEDEDDEGGEDSEDEPGSEGEDGLGEEEDEMGEDGNESARRESPQARRLPQVVERGQEERVGLRFAPGPSEEEDSSDESSGDHHYGFDADGYDDAMDDYENDFNGYENDFNGYEEGEFDEDDFEEEG